MDTQTITLELSATAYENLQALAQAEQKEPGDVIAELLNAARQQSLWRQELAALRQQIRQDGGLNVGTTRNDVVNTLRKTRSEIFEAEYAHLYR
jgi:16S rRNA G1207 methylase RsmC